MSTWTWAPHAKVQASLHHICTVSCMIWEIRLMQFDRVKCWLQWQWYNLVFHSVSKKLRRLHYKFISLCSLCSPAVDYDSYRSGLCKRLHIHGRLRCLTKELRRLLKLASKLINIATSQRWQVADETTPTRRWKSCAHNDILYSGNACWYNPQNNYNKAGMTVWQHEFQ